jgi:predicted nuclease of restriction endonuclease-like RecB superfamily
MAKTCAVCGLPSGMYPLCQKCFKLRDEGKIIQCPDCKVWYKIDGDHICGNKQKNDEHQKKNTLEYAKQAIIKKEDFIDTSDPRSKWEAVNRSEDGHYVRSYSEVLIDNWLYNHGYVHAYEKSVFMPTNPDETILCDFYLPKGKVYIEFWGLDNNYYLKRKEHKIALYKANNLNLINLYEDDIKLLDDKMPRLLFEFIKE